MTRAESNARSAWWMAKAGSNRASNHSSSLSAISPAARFRFHRPLEEKPSPCCCRTNGTPGKISATRGTTHPLNANNTPARIQFWMSWAGVWFAWRGWVQYAGADSILDELGREAVIARSLPLDRRVPVIIPGAFLRDDEIAALIPEIKAGRRLLWWSPSFYCWGHACRELLGAEIVDFFPDHRANFTWQGSQRDLPGFPERTMPVVRPLESARVEIQKEDPLLLCHKLGAGEI